MANELLEASAALALETVDALAERLRDEPARLVAAARGDGSDPVGAICELARLLAAVDPAAVNELLRGRHVAVPVPGGHVYAELGDWTTLVVMHERAWEKPLLDLCRRHVTRGHTVLDVGAHIGTYTVLFASLVGATGRVIAFEPLPANADLLERTVALNDLAAVVDIARVAVSSAAGHADLVPYAGVEPGPKRYPEASSMLHSLVVGDGYAGSGVSVPVTTLDAYAQERGIEAVHFIKIDTEGAEARILAHGRELIARSPTVVLLVELHPTELTADGGSVADVVDLVRSAGFDITELSYDGRRLRQRELPAGDPCAGTHLLARRKRR